MIDNADLAILETYEDRMNPVELQLLAEVKRLRDEAEEVAELEGKVLQLEEELDAAKSENVNNQEEIERLEKKVDEAEELTQASDYAKECAVRALEEFKASFRALVA